MVPTEDLPRSIPSPPELASLEAAQASGIVAVFPPMGQRPELDGLRFLAFAGVFGSHCLPWVLAPIGAYGVDLFFVLSSFLITRILLSEWEEARSIHVGAFWMRRILRIWPLYFAFLAVAAIFAAAPAEMLRSFGLFVGNWWIARHGFQHTFVDPLWSISIEEQFYLFWPLILWLVLPRSTDASAAQVAKRRLLLTSLVLVGMAVMVRGLLAFNQVRHPAVSCNTLARLDCIGLGAALAALDGQRHWRRMLGVVRAGVVVLVLAAWTFACYRLSPDGSLAVGGYLIVSAGAALLVFVAGGSEGLLTLAPLRFLGRISYGLYVFHIFAIERTEFVVAAVRSPRVATLLHAGLAFAVCVAMASASYFLLERPFLRLKRRWTPGSPVGVIPSEWSSQARPSKF